MKTDHDTIRRAKAGEPAAIKALVDGNMGLVVRLAKSYTSSRHSLEDLVQEGVVGLLSAIEPFDLRRSVRFATYAMTHVQKHMGRFVAGEGLRQYETRKAFQRDTRARTSLAARGIYDPTDEQLAEQIGGIKARHVALARLATGMTASIDAPVGESGGRLVDTLVSDEESAEERLIREEREAGRKNGMVRALKGLDAKISTVVKRRHFAKTPDTFEDIGKAIGVSRETARKLEARGLEQIRDSIRGF